MGIFLTCVVLLINWTALNGSSNIKLGRGLIHFEKLKGNDFAGEPKSPDIYDRLSFIKDTTSNRTVEKSMTKGQQTPGYLLNVAVEPKILDLNDKVSFKQEITRNRTVENPMTEGHPIPVNLLKVNYPKYSLDGTKGQYHIEGAGLQEHINRLPSDVILNSANLLFQSKSSLDTSPEKTEILYKNKFKKASDIRDHDETELSGIKQTGKPKKFEDRKQNANVKYKIIQRESNVSPKMQDIPNLYSVHLKSHVKISDPKQHPKISPANPQHLSGSVMTFQHLYENLSKQLNSDNEILDTVKGGNNFKFMQRNSDINNHILSNVVPPDIQLKFSEKSNSITKLDKNLERTLETKPKLSVVKMKDNSTLPLTDIAMVADGLTRSLESTTTVPLMAATETVFIRNASSSIKGKTDDVVMDDEDDDNEFENDDGMISERQKAINRRKFYDMLAELKRKLMKNISSSSLNQTILRPKHRVLNNDVDNDYDSVYDWYSDSASELDYEESRSEELFSQRGDNSKGKGVVNGRSGKHKFKSDMLRTLSDGFSSEFFSESSENIPTSRSPLNFDDKPRNKGYNDFMSSDFFSDSFEGSSYENEHPLSTERMSNANFYYQPSSEEPRQEIKRKRQNKRFNNPPKTTNNANSFWSDESYFDSSDYNDYYSNSYDDRDFHYSSSEEYSDKYYTDSVEDSDKYYTDSVEDSDKFYTESVEDNDLYYSSSFEDSDFDYSLEEHKSNTYKFGSSMKTLYEDRSHSSNKKGSLDIIDDDRNVKSNMFGINIPVEKLKISNKRLRGMIRSAFQENENKKTLLETFN